MQSDRCVEHPHSASSLAPVLVATLALFAGSCAMDDGADPRVHAVETGLPVIHVDGHPDLQLSLQEWMAALDVPGLSIVVIDRGEIAWERGYGVIEAGGDEAVTPGTLFQAASISKPLTAVALLHHVEAGDFDLDAPADDYLTTWRLQDESGGTDHGVTLRQILSHTAGITPGGFPGYPRGGPVPTLFQILDGAPPATNRPAMVAGRPEAQVQYSGLAFEVMQLAMTDHLGQPFPRILADSVFEPIGLSNTVLDPERDAPAGASIARGHDADGRMIEGGWRLYPETAAAGIWSTPTDLARVLLEVQQALHGESDRVISQAMAQEMLTEVMDGEGLSWVLRVREDGSLVEFSHSGGNAGFRAHMRMNPETGQGLVLMTNSDNGLLLLSPLLQSVATAYAWPEQPDREVPPNVAVRILAARDQLDIDLPQALLERYVGRYELEPGFDFDVRLEDGMLAVQLGDQPRLIAYPESQDTFYYREVNAQLTFVLGGDGPAERLILRQYGRHLTAERVPDSGE